MLSSSFNSRNAIPSSPDQRSRTEAVRFCAGLHVPQEHYITWVGWLAAVLLGLLALLLLAAASSWLRFGTNAPAVALEETPLGLPADEFASQCDEVGSAAVLSPQEGVWFERNCRPPAALLPEDYAPSACNRTSLDPGEFTQISANLYAYRQVQGGTAYVWFASASDCFDLVSTRVVAAVCVDESLAFEWKPAACSANGGVLFWLNGS